MIDNPPAPIYFDATLRPHRSLSRTGFLIVMTAIAGCGFLIGIAFFLAGAWPVAGFCGLEIALVYIAFRMNFREGRRAEHLRLTDDGLEISRIAPSGRVENQILPAGWLTIRMDDPPRHESRLTVSSQGRMEEVGHFLQPYERAEVAQALREALARYRTASA